MGPCQYYRPIRVDIYDVGAGALSAPGQQQSSFNESYHQRQVICMRNGREIPSGTCAGPKVFKANCRAAPLPQHRCLRACVCSHVGVCAGRQTACLRRRAYVWPA